MFPIFGVSGPRTSDPQRTRRFMGALSFKVDCCRRTILSLACHSLAAIIVAVRRLQPAKFPSVFRGFWAVLLLPCRCSLSCYRREECVNRYVP